ncbi:hypothetical protein QTP88_005756 [Uroleucon formosanum]
MVKTFSRSMDTHKIMVVGGEEGGKNDDDDDNNAEKTTPTQWFVKLSLATMGAACFIAHNLTKSVYRV